MVFFLPDLLLILLLILLYQGKKLEVLLSIRQIRTTFQSPPLVLFSYSYGV